MIPKYIEDWLDVIENMNNDNTYKLAWGRAILECISFSCYKEVEDTIEIELDDIAKRIFKYYWNQLFFFNLKQSPYKDKNVKICSIVEGLIKKYKELEDSSIPVWSDIGEELLIKKEKSLYEKSIKKIAKATTENVAYRFKHVKSSVIDLYQPYKPVDKIVFKLEDAKLLKDYGIILSKLLNYKWSQLLEGYNICPRITSKVNGISATRLKRQSLSKFKDELIKQFADGKIYDFYDETKELNIKDISIDHVIPWSFMYSDDIWNLVITSKSKNSSKSNSIPSKEIIEKLKARNLELEKKKILEKTFELQLEEANKNNYVDKFYYDCKM